MSYLLHTLFCFHFGAVFEYHRHIFLALSYNFLHQTAPKGIVKFCDNAFLVLCHSCVLCYRILRKFYRHSDFFLQGITLGFQFRIM